MELIFKRPDGKLPFLGLIFESEFKGAKLNQEAVHAGEPCMMKIDIVGASVTLRLINDNNGFFHMYQDPITCNVKHLQEWRERTRDPYNFGHIVREGDKDRVIRTQLERKIWVVRISRLYIDFEH